MAGKTKANPVGADPRTYWAVERTFLAWLRTGLALMGFGFVVARFGLFLRMFQARGDMASPGGTAWSTWFGTALVLLGALVQLGALADYLRVADKLKKGSALDLKPSPLGIGAALCLIVIGLAMAGYLIVKD